ncbi:MAG: hypothetical protein J1E37_01195 [Prevotella sp.]|nr:hypothetical protein [Prevotella sp.]
MKKLSYLVLSFMAICLFSCGGQSKEQAAHVDSLETSLDQRNEDYQQLDEFLTIIAASLDSISMQENSLYNYSAESPVPNQTKIRQQLANLKETLKSQRERISELEKQLDVNSSSARKMQSIINTLKAQLEEKEAQIAALQEEIGNRDITIEELRGYMAQLTQQNVEQRDTIEIQNRTIQMQDEQLNEAYVITGTKSALKEAGLLDGGFLKKTKININSINRNMARTIDIRKTQDININAKSIKVLTQMPENSYSIEKTANKTSILHITDPQRFWSVSKYLVIQTD